MAGHLHERRVIIRGEVHGQFVLDFPQPFAGLDIASAAAVRRPLSEYGQYLLAGVSCRVGEEEEMLVVAAVRGICELCTYPWHAAPRARFVCVAAAARVVASRCRWWRAVSARLCPVFAA